MNKSSSADAMDQPQVASLLRVGELLRTAARLDELLPPVAQWVRTVAGVDLVAVVLPIDEGPRARLYTVAISSYGAAAEEALIELPSVARERVTHGDNAERAHVRTLREGAGEYPELVTALRAREQSVGCFLPLATAFGPLGLIAFAWAREETPDPEALDYLQCISAQVAVAVDNLRHNEEARARERMLQAERGHWRTLLELNNAVVTTRDLHSVLNAIAPNLQRVVQHDTAALVLLRSGGKQLGLYAISAVVPGWTDDVAAEIRPDSDPIATWLEERRAVRIEIEHFDWTGRERLHDVMAAAGELDLCLVPLATPRRVLGYLFMTRRTPSPFTDAELERATQAGSQIAIALENALAFGEIAELKDRLARENIYLEEAFRGAQHFGEIVGESKALRRILQQVETVAGTEATVLLLGETGTGKELIARAIHSASDRHARALVAVNCATSPAGLLESEWFGHERGAFTGALSQKVGRFELAHQGTLFLDEIGDVPLELQSKLLRVLQEHELERLGSTRTIRVDFRLIAATNRNLEEMVGAREFRSDLYYRLNVFPIRIPPLRERPEDIPLLVLYFTQRFARQLRKPIESVARESMGLLCRWPWPGNVRELQNVIERAVILSQGPTLAVSRAEFESAPSATTAPVTLEAAEREHIMRALEQTDWVIGGPRGAAARLGLKRTSLVSTMRRLGIVRPKPGGRK